MKQLRDNWKKDQITKEEATNNIRYYFRCSSGDVPPQFCAQLSLGGLTLDIGRCINIRPLIGSIPEYAIGGLVGGGSGLDTSSSFATKSDYDPQLDYSSNTD